MFQFLSKLNCVFRGFLLRKGMVFYFFLKDVLMVSVLERPRNVYHLVIPFPEIIKSLTSFFFERMLPVEWPPKCQWV